MYESHADEKGRQSHPSVTYHVKLNIDVVIPRKINIHVILVIVRHAKLFVISNILSVNISVKLFVTSMLL